MAGLARAIPGGKWIRPVSTSDKRREHDFRAATAAVMANPSPVSAGPRRAPTSPEVLNIADILALQTPEPKLLIETLLPIPGAILLAGAAKSGKTLLAVQAALAVASGRPLFDYYRVLEPGPVLMVEQDDPAGAAGLKTILQCSPEPITGIPFQLVERVPFTFGIKLIEWLEQQITTYKLRLVVLDSYTALRASRGVGVDIVKAEQMDMTMLDQLAKRTNCTIIVIHHASKGSAAMDWSDRAAGTFAMSAATEAQIHVSRFAELDSAAPERLVRIRGRPRRCPRSCPALRARQVHRIPSSAPTPDPASHRGRNRRAGAPSGDRGSRSTPGRDESHA
jgi:hypothetical protein